LTAQLKPSELQFKEPVLMTSHFDRLNFMPNVKTKLSIEFGMTQPDSDNKTIGTQMAVSIANDGAENPFITLIYQTEFYWTNEIEAGVLVDLVKQNGQAMVLSYVRGNVHGILAYANLPALHIPMLDLRTID
jgi:preprotein translocase subunit SecB